MRCKQITSNSNCLVGCVLHGLLGTWQAVHAHRDHVGVCICSGGEAGCYQQALLQWLQTQSGWVIRKSFISQLNMHSEFTFSLPEGKAFIVYDRIHYWERFVICQTLDLANKWGNTWEHNYFTGVEQELQPLQTWQQLCFLLYTTTPAVCFWT